MAVDVTKLNFYSGNPIDKVVYEGSVTIVNDGATSFPEEAKIVTSTQTNPYGKAVLARARWSVDGGSSWQNLNSRLLYGFTNAGTTQWGLKAAISIGCSSSQVHFRTANGYHGDVVAGAYTPTSQTFLIEYALFEDVPV